MRIGIVGAFGTLLLLGAPYALASEAVVHTSTTASADTGGNTVASGGSVTVGEASVTVTSRVRAGQEGAHVETEVSTEANGTTTHESHEETFAPGEPVEVGAAASAASQGLVHAVPVPQAQASSTASSTPPVRRGAWPMRAVRGFWHWCITLF